MPVLHIGVHIFFRLVQMPGSNQKLGTCIHSQSPLRVKEAAQSVRLQPVPLLGLQQIYLRKHLLHGSTGVWKTQKVFYETRQH